MKAKRLEEWKKFNTYEAHGVNGDSVLEKVDKLKSILSELPTLIQEEERKKEAKAKIAVGVQEKLQVMFASVFQNFCCVQKMFCRLTGIFVG